MLYALFLTLVLCLGGMAQDLPMFRGGPERLGVYGSTAPKKSPDIKWVFQTGGYVISSPAVAGRSVFVGSMDGSLYALDLETGKPRWTVRSGGPIASSPAFSGSLVYFGSFDGIFYAVNFETGTIAWKFETAGERRFSHVGLHGLLPNGELKPDPWDFYLSSPTIFSGMVYFGSGDGSVYALDADTGELRWRFRTGDVVHSSPAIADGTVFVGSFDGILYALEATSGKIKWRFQSGIDPQNGNQQGFQSSPAVSDGTVYVGGRDSKMYAINAETGKLNWEVSTRGSWVLTSPAVHDGKVYFGTSDTALLRVVEAESGSEVASIDAKFPLYSSPAIANGVLYIGTFGGKFLALDLENNELLWEFQTEASSRNLAAYSGPDGKIAFGKAIGTNFYDDMVLGVSKLLTTGSILSSPAIKDGVIYFGSADGNIYALE